MTTPKQKEYQINYQLKQSCMDMALKREITLLRAAEFLGEKSRERRRADCYLLGEKWDGIISTHASKYGEQATIKRYGLERGTIEAIRRRPVVDGSEMSA